jgi:diguanylate cyclase (GGDEF)-like protein/PAS domain S-box-containing protein
MNEAGTTSGSASAGVARRPTARQVVNCVAARTRALPGRLGASLIIVAFCVLLIGLLWGMVAFKVRAEKAVEIKTVRKDTANLARVFEEHVLRTVREADQVLQFIIDQYRSQGRTVDLRRLMEDGPIISRIYLELGVFNARGELVASSLPAGRADLSAREHIRAHAARDTGQLFIGKPVLRQASGKWSLQLSRRINSPDLSFGGVAVVSIDPQTFSQLYSRTELGELAMITLVGQDGVVRARRSRNEANATVDTTRWALFKILPSSPNGSYISTSAVDGLKRIFSYRALMDYPLVVLVGAAESEALAEFHERRRGYYEAAGFATLVIFGFTAFLLLMVRRREAMARMLQRHNAELAQLAAIVRSSDDAIVSTTPDGVIQTWNAGAETLFGHSSAQAVGQPITLVYAAPERLVAWSNLDAIKHGERHYEATRVRRDGTPVPVSVTAFPIPGQSGAVAAIGAIYRDISERRKAEAVRAELAAIVEQSNDAIISRSPEGCFVSWNAGAERMFGYTAAEAIGQPISLILPPHERAGVEEKLERTRHGQGIKVYETQRVTRDGRVIDVLSSVSPIKDATGKLGSVSIIFHDITERKKADAAIKASESRVRAILDNDPECVALISRQSGLMEINRAGLAMLEAATLEEVRRHGLASFVRSEHRDCFTECLGNGVDDGPVDIEVEISGLRGARRWLQCRLAPMHLAETGGDSLLVVARDITEHKRNQEKIEYLSHHDALTGLPNRNLFQDRLELAVAQARRRGEVLGVLLANLDRFKKVNESLGREAGDQLLREVAARLKSSLHEVDTIARLGGDDYAILVEGATGVEGVIGAAEKLTQTLATPFEVKGHEIFVSASVGVASCVNGACTAAKLLESAEIAAARAKRDGSGGYYVYQDEPITLSGRRLTLESRLRRALENGELVAHYQPKIDLLTGSVTGAEALARWDSPELGAINPAQFIPMAEETGLIVPIGAWILETACGEAARWRAAGHDLNIAVNLSPRQFRQKELVSMVAAILQCTGLEPQHLELEITEGTAMSNAEQTEAVLAELHELGVKLAVDDFGTGYSSLSYLRRFPLHCLKIDRSFVRDAAASTDSAAIVRATIALAHSLRLKVVAEGIETEAQRALLLHAACDEGQGYLFSKPVPAASFEKLLETQRRGTRGARAAARQTH